MQFWHPQAAKQGTDLQDIVRLILDEQARPAALAQLGSCDTPAAAGIALHVGLWLVDRRRQALRWIHDAGGTDLTLDDLDLVAELLLTACAKLALRCARIRRVALTCWSTLGTRAHPPHLLVHGPGIRLAGAPVAA